MATTYPLKNALSNYTFPLTAKNGSARPAGVNTRKNMPLVVAVTATKLTKNPTTALIERISQQAKYEPAPKSSASDNSGSISKLQTTKQHVFTSPNIELSASAGWGHAECHPSRGGPACARIDAAPAPTTHYGTAGGVRSVLR
ncbi:hypothetical protein CHS0354_032548 [Potamilus streckersoni]|uniref:Uncharacterized protein n=1 Tax=Potamilus streckersoni TaxID=2493646 RepID=A0AAE0W0Q0_9BIVA|nr:hypothetical protein CHS0354_032548 [Potamilus streckersoni]